MPSFVPLAIVALLTFSAATANALVLASTAPAVTWNFIGQAGCHQSGGANCTTSAINTTGADLIVIVVSQGIGTSSPPTDSQSNSFIIAISDSASGVNGEILYVHAPSTSASHTFTTGANPGNVGSMIVMVFSGSAASPLDQTRFSFAASSGGPNYQPGSILPTLSNELLILGYAGAGATSVPAVTSPTMTNRGFIAGVPSQYFGSAGYSLVQSVAASVNPTITTVPNDAMELMIVSFKP